MTAPVPYQFANTPNGATIPLNQLDANFQYLVNEIGGNQVVSPNELTALGPVWNGTGRLWSQGDLYSGSGIIGTLASPLPILQMNSLGFEFSVNTNPSLLVQNNGIQVQNSIKLTQNIGGILTLSPPNASVNTQFTFPPNMGDDGYVLSTDGAGITSWIPPYAAAVTSFSAGTTGLLPETSTTGSIILSGILNPDSGGTGIGTIPTAGQILIGNGTGFSLSQLTAGNGISIVNGSGTITIGLAANIGVTTISGGSTGLVFGTGTGDITVTGRLNIGSGGTNAVTAQGAINNLVSNVTTNGYVLQGNGTNVVMGALTPTLLATAGTLSNPISTSTVVGTTVTSPTFKSNAAGIAPVFQDGAGAQIGTLCRGWAKFTITGTSIVINASFNITSIVYISAGRYVVTFTNALADANYAVNVTAASNFGSTFYVAAVDSSSLTAGAFNIQCAANGGSAGDPGFVSFSVFR